MDFTPLKTLSLSLQTLVERKLWAKVLVGMFMGALVGLFLSSKISHFPTEYGVVISNWLSVPGKLFLKMIQMIMMPLIFVSIITGIVNSPVEELKKIGGFIIFYFFLSTIISVFIGVGTSLLINPGGMFPEDNQYARQTVKNQIYSQGDFVNLPEYMMEILPGNPLASMVSGELLSVVVFTFIIGISITQLKDQYKQPIILFSSSIQQICITVVKWAMRLVPYAVFGLMTNLVYSTGTETLKGLAIYLETVFVAFLFMVMVYSILLLISGRNPLVFFKKSKEVLLLAFSTTSSAAVMPLSIQTAQEKLKISKHISNLIIPLGTTINMDGTAIYQCVSTVFIAQVCGLNLDVSTLLFIVITITLASIGTPGIPGAGIVVLASTLEGMGIPTAALVLIVGLERILGMFRTMVNVIGDLTACVIFEKFT